MKALSGVAAPVQWSDAAARLHKVGMSVRTDGISERTTMTTMCPPTELDDRPVLLPQSLLHLVDLYDEALAEAGRQAGALALSHLHEQLITQARFADLARTLFKNTVWTRIVWPRSLGHPSGAAMSGGFDVQLKYLEINGEIGPDGLPRNTSRWRDSHYITLWDGPHDDEVYRVSVMARGQSPWLHWMGVALRSGVRWEGVDSPLWLRPVRRVIYPAELTDDAGTFTLDEDGITTLGDFRVARW